MKFKGHTNEQSKGTSEDSPLEGNQTDPIPLKSKPFEIERRSRGSNREIEGKPKGFPNFEIEKNSKGSPPEIEWKSKGFHSEVFSKLTGLQTTPHTRTPTHTVKLKGNPEEPLKLEGKPTDPLITLEIERNFSGPSLPLRWE